MVFLTFFGEAQSSRATRAGVRHAGSRWSCWPSCRSSAASSSCRATLGDRPLFSDFLHTSLPRDRQSSARRHGCSTCRSSRRSSRWWASALAYLLFLRAAAAGRGGWCATPVGRGAAPLLVRRLGLRLALRHGSSSGPSSGWRASNRGDFVDLIYRGIAWHQPARLHAALSRDADRPGALVRGGRRRRARSSPWRSWCSL